MFFMFRIPIRSRSNYDNSNDGRSFNGIPAKYPETYWEQNGKDNSILFEYRKLNDWKFIYRNSKCKNCLCNDCNDCQVFARINYLRENYCSDCGNEFVIDCKSCPILAIIGKIKFLETKLTETHREYYEKHLKYWTNLKEISLNGEKLTDEYIKEHSETGCLAELGEWN